MSVRTKSTDSNSKAAGSPKKITEFDIKTLETRAKDMMRWSTGNTEVNVKFLEQTGNQLILCPDRWFSEHYLVKYNGGKGRFLCRVERYLGYIGLDKFTKMASGEYLAVSLRDFQNQSEIIIAHPLFADVLLRR